MDKHDIVYFLKDTFYNEELRFSLRSVERNFPHARVIFAGGCPRGFKPDLHIELEQSRFETKWDNVSSNIKQVCENDDISENFFLFNDDFFILKPVKNWNCNCYNGDLEKLSKQIIENNNDKTSRYVLRLNDAQKALEEKGYTIKNFELHCPMLINRKKMLKILDDFGADTPAKRSLYGNVYYAEESGRACKDHKIVNPKDEIRPNSWFVSTEDTAFRIGKIGLSLRKDFNGRSRFEI